MEQFLKLWQKLAYQSGLDQIDAEYHLREAAEAALKDFNDLKASVAGITERIEELGRQVVYLQEQIDLPNWRDRR